MDEDSNTIANNRAKLGLPLQPSCSTAPEHRSPTQTMLSHTSNVATNAASNQHRSNVVEVAEDHMRSSRANSISSSSVLSVMENKDCDYLKLVMGFKRTLMLPDVFFTGDSFACYCDGCVPSLHNSAVKGWARFKINPQTLSSSCATNTSEDSVWTTVYYNARVEKIRSVLDHGQPLPIGRIQFYVH